MYSHRKSGSCTVRSSCPSNIFFFQREVDDMVGVWDAHHIRPTRNKSGPHGRPVVMYRLPSAYDTQSYIQPVDFNKIDVCKTECIFRDQYTCDGDIEELCEILMEENGWESPTTLDEALVLYCLLRDEINYELQL